MKTTIESILGKKMSDSASVFQLTSRRPKAKFRGTNIDAFIPYGQGPEAKRLFRTQSGEVDSLFIFKHSSILDGIKSLNDKHNIDILIQHDNVLLTDYTEEEHRKMVQANLKRSNPEWELKNLDLEQDNLFDEGQKLLELRYWLRNPLEPVSFDKAVFYCSYLGIPYRLENNKYSENVETYRKKLIGKIDDRIQKHPELFEKLKTVKDQSNKIEKYFFINELKLKSIITFRGTLYFIGEQPIGPTDESLFKYFESNIEVYQGLKNQILEENKAENVFKGLAKAEVVT